MAIGAKVHIHIGVERGKLAALPFEIRALALELQPRDFARAGEVAAGGDASARVGIEQGKIVGTDRKAQVTLHADAAIQLHIRAAQPDIDTMELPVAAAGGSRGLALAGDGLATQFSRQLRCREIQRALRTEGRATGVEIKTHLARQIRAQARGVETGHPARDAPALGRLPACFARELRRASQRLDGGIVDLQRFAGQQTAELRRHGGLIRGDDIAIQRDGPRLDATQRVTAANAFERRRR